MVVKFGGSNLKKKEDLQRIIQSVRNYNRPLVIVVSAFYGITSYLTESLEVLPDDHSSADEITASLEKIKRETIKENIPDPDQQANTLALIQERLEELRRNLLGIHYIGDTPRFVRDRILSYGERLSSLLLTQILQAHGLDAREALPEDIGLLTDGEYENATIDLMASEESVKQALRHKGITVIPGFYGMSKEGRVTLLGRGGSDYSAAALARCLNAESLDIWKDVNGYLSADPSLVESPRRIEALSYTEAAELSYFGARILHPRTVEPLLDRAIPIRIFNIEAEGQAIRPLSVIHTDRILHEDRVKSVTYNDDFAILKLLGPGVGMKHGILARITSRLDDAGINIKSVVTSQTVINLYLNQADLNPAFHCLKQMDLPSLSEIQPEGNLSIVAMVGEGVTENPAVMDKALSALRGKGIPLQIISLGASEVAAYLVMEKHHRSEAVKTVHEALFGTS